MNMTEALDKWLRLAFQEVTETDAKEAIDFMVENVSSDSAQLFRLEVSAARRREYQRDLMRKRRQTLLREKLHADEKGI